MQYAHVLDSGRQPDQELRQLIQEQVARNQDAAVNNDEGDADSDNEAEAEEQ